MTTLPINTLLALKLSIQHWNRLATGKRRCNETVTTDDCALCAMFNNPAINNTGCHGCPVSDDTGKAYCEDTPYHEAYEALDENNFDMNSPQFKAAARKELAYLKSLVPKEERKRP